MQTYIKKWGNSLGLRIPMQLAKKLQLHSGSAVTIEVKNGELIIKPPKYNLEEMLNEITLINKHHQILEDKQQGNEEW